MLFGSWPLSVFTPIYNKCTFNKDLQNIFYETKFKAWPFEFKKFVIHGNAFQKTGLKKP